MTVQPSLLRGRRFIAASVFAVLATVLPVGWLSAGAAADFRSAITGLQARVPGQSAIVVEPRYWGQSPLGQSIRTYRALEKLLPGRTVAVVRFPVRQLAGADAQNRGRTVDLVVASTPKAGYRAKYMLIGRDEHGNSVVLEKQMVPDFTVNGRTEKTINMDAEKLLGIARFAVAAWFEKYGLNNHQVKDMEVELRPCKTPKHMCAYRVKGWFPEVEVVGFNAEHVDHPHSDFKSKAVLGKAFVLWVADKKPITPNYTGSTSAYLHGSKDYLDEMKAGDLTLSSGPPIQNQVPSTDPDEDPDPDGGASAPKPDPLPKPDPKSGGKNVPVPVEVVVPGGVPGGIDLSTVDLRYVADPGPAKSQGPQLTFAGRATKGDQHAETGLADLSQANDAFYVMLTTTPDKLWVNLNPTEPDRIIDPVLAGTDAGRIMLKADLQMKKTTAKLINPNSAVGKVLWSKLEARNPDVCLSFRQWITPATATVRPEGDGIYLVSTPLRVQLESDYVNDPAANSGCLQASSTTEARNEALLRKYVLPKVQKAVNSAPEYAELRRVYRSRVAAEWYRQHSLQVATTYGDYVDRNATKYWPAPKRWSPESVFKAYVKSYENGEFKVTRKTRKDGWITTRTYVYGGVDLDQVPMKTQTDREFARSGWPALAASSATAPVTDGKGSVWLSTRDDSRYVTVSTRSKGSVSPAGDGDGDGDGGHGSGGHGSGGGWWSRWYLLLVPELLLLRWAYRTRDERSLPALALPVVLVVVTMFVVPLAHDDPPAATASSASNRPPAQPRTSLVKALAPAPDLPEPQTVLDVERKKIPTRTKPHQAGTCLAGHKFTGSGTTPKMTEVSCSSSSARYKVIKRFLNSYDTSACFSVRGTRWIYSEKLLVNNVPTSSVVYCVKNA
jgi:hypothetical protein